MSTNQLCGLYYEFGDLKGRYTAQGIAEMCKWINGMSAVTSLK